MPYDNKKLVNIIGVEKELLIIQNHKSQWCVVDANIFEFDNANIIYR